MSTTAPSPTRPRPGAGGYLAAGLALVALALGAVALAVLLHGDSTSTTQGSGVVVEQARELPPFTAVDLAGANTVRIGIGGSQTVVVRGEEDVLPLVTTEVEDGTLVIAQSESFDTASTLTVDVVVPALDAVELSGAGTVTVDGHDLDLLALSLPGAGTMRGSGDADGVEVELGGTGDIELGTLVAKTATVSLSGTGNVRVHATDSLDARVSGTGSIFYAGEPENVTREITGTGAIVEG